MESYSKYRGCGMKLDGFTFVECFIVFMIILLLLHWRPSGLGFQVSRAV